MKELLAIAGLSLLCGVWVLVQRWVARHDPEAPGVEGSCGCSRQSSPPIHAGSAASTERRTPSQGKR